MWILLLPLLAVAIIGLIGVALFVFLPVKWAIAAAVLCVIAIGAIMSVTDRPFH